MPVSAPRRPVPFDASAEEPATSGPAVSNNVNGMTLMPPTSRDASHPCSAVGPPPAVPALLLHACPSLLQPRLTTDPRLRKAPINPCGRPSSCRVGSDTIHIFECSRHLSLAPRRHLSNLCSKIGPLLLRLQPQFGGWLLVVTGPPPPFGPPLQQNRLPLAAPPAPPHTAPAGTLTA